MSEMLGNQYFLARKYDLAARELQHALINEPQSKAIRKKLIICEVQRGKLKRALELFLDLVMKDVSSIVKTDPILDDCPCPELVYDIEVNIKDHKSSSNYILKLAMLWLYCNIKKSIQYFNDYQKVNPNNPHITNILSQLTKYLLEHDNEGN